MSPWCPPSQLHLAQWKLQYIDKIGTLPIETSILEHTASHLSVAPVCDEQPEKFPGHCTVQPVTVPLDCAFLIHSVTLRHGENMRKETGIISKTKESETQLMYESTVSLDLCCFCVILCLNM